MTKVALSNPVVRVETRPDGTMLLSSVEALLNHPARVADLVAAWAQSDPERIALADRLGDPDEWRTLTYGAFVEQTARLGQGLLDRGLGPERPLMLVSENRIEAALTMFAAYRAGVPVAPITPAYSAGSDRSRLRSILETLKPGLVVVDRPAVHAAALADVLPSDVPVVGMTSGASVALADLMTTEPGPTFAAAEASVEGDTVAKILFTSGSTGTPKGAINTHRMLASNAQMQRQAWPFLAEEPPIVVDWLPWNHTFGGNFVLNTVLTTGGTLYIDDGKPMPGLIERSVRNGAEAGPTIHVNAPRGLDMVARVLAEDSELAERFFARLAVVFFASAGLPPRIRNDWLRLIERHAKRPVAFCSAWGATETAPLATALNFDAPQINNIGTPASGVTIKLAPVGDRYELLVSGPNVTPGYLGRPCGGSNQRRRGAEPPFDSRAEPWCRRFRHRQHHG